MNDSTVKEWTGNCCGQVKPQDPIEELRALETDLSTPEVTVPLEQYQKILDGISAHNEVLLRQKKAIESRLISTRKFSTNFLEQAGARIRQLQDELDAANGLIALGDANLNAQCARIDALETALRKAKRGSRK